MKENHQICNCLLKRSMFCTNCFSFLILLKIFFKQKKNFRTGKQKCFCFLCLNFFDLCINVTEILCTKYLKEKIEKSSIKEKIKINKKKKCAGKMQ